MAAKVTISIRKAVGAKDRRGEAPNELEDLKKVQQLLNLALGREKVAVAVRVGDKANLQATILEIREFQSLCTGLVTDGRVDPAPGWVVPLGIPATAPCRDESQSNRHEDKSCDCSAPTPWSSHPAAMSTSEIYDFGLPLTLKWP